MQHHSGSKGKGTSRPFPSWDKLRSRMAPMACPGSQRKLVVELDPDMALLVQVPGLTPNHTSVGCGYILCAQGENYANKARIKILSLLGDCSFRVAHIVPDTSGLLYTGYLYIHN